MTTTDLAERPETVIPDEVIVNGEAVAPEAPDPHDENIAALSPCPMCGASSAEAPEGLHDGVTGPLGRPRWHFAHCFKCGYNHREPRNVGLVAGPATLPAGLTKEIAAQIATQVHSALGLPEGTRLADVLERIQGAPPVAVTSAAQAPAMPSATDIAREMLRLQREEAAPPATAETGEA
jgi:hypothetical protein